MAIDFLWTSPYGGSWVDKMYETTGASRGGLKKVSTVHELEAHVKHAARTQETKPLLIMGNFIRDRGNIKARALDLGLDVVHGEDGFLPHYSTLHADPVGFCWESSLCSMKFPGKVPDTVVNYFAHLVEHANKLVRRNPFEANTKNVLFPLQLLNDQVNAQGLGVRGDWTEYIALARKLLPEDVILWVKQHPRAIRAADLETRWAMTQRNVKMYNGKLEDALYYCDGVVGMNSTVLTEARLLYNKPVWAFAKSWYTGHPDLVCLVKADMQVLPEVDKIDTGVSTDEYTDKYRQWYAGQLLARQYKHTDVRSNSEKFRQWLLQRTYKSFLAHGEEIFTLK